LRLSGLHLAVALVSVGSASCAFLEDRVNDEIGERLPDRNGLPPGGDGGGDGDVVVDCGDSDPEPEPVPQEDLITVNSVQANRGVTLGGTTVEVLGLNFVSGLEVYFGSEPATDVVFLSPNRLRCVTPPRDDIGFVGVQVRNPVTDELAVRDFAFEYFEPVTALELTPARASSEGGADLDIIGTGFVEGTTVSFGVGSDVDALIIDSANLRVTVPELPRGVYTVTVANLNGEASLIDGFSTFDPVRVDTVVPFAGPLGGGTSVRVTGTGFVDPTTLHLRTHEVTPTTQSTAGVNDPSETELDATTVAMAAGTPEGLADVMADNANGASMLKDSFVFFDQTNLTPRVVAVMPGAALVGGGSSIKIAGVGFDSTTAVSIDGVTLTSCVRLGGNMITCTAPPGAEGPADLRVSNGGSIDATFAFEYLNLRITLADPASGAIAGGTYVRLTGEGFGSDARVFINGRVARDLSVDSLGDLTLRTPRGAVGPADIRVLTRGVELTVGGLYSYFDPADYTFWTSGGPVEGSVNVTVIGNAGQPLRGAFVVLGAQVDPLRPYRHGYTDIRGQITFSGPEIWGPQSVHAFKDDHGAFSWISTDARNLTMDLGLLADPEPPPDPLPPCPEPSGQGGPALVRGKVIRIKDQWNTGNDTVLVTSSYVSFSVPLPDPGPRAQLVNNGDYEAFVRSGDLVLIAQAGKLGPTTGFNVAALGFRPFVYTEASSARACCDDSMCDDGEECWRASEGAPEGSCTRVYDDMDIVIDTPLSQTMRIDFESPPLGITGSYPAWTKPNTTSAFVWYDFGSMGLWPMGSAASGTATLYLTMPRQLPETLSGTPFHVSADCYGVGIFGDQTWSSVYKPYNYSTRDTVVLTPVLRALREIEPNLGDLVGNPIHVDFEQLPVNSAPNPTGNLHYIYDVVSTPVCEGPLGVIAINEILFHWMALSPGNVGTMDLPVLPAPNVGLNIPSSFVGMQLMGLYSPSADFNNLDLNELFDWQSQTGRATGFVAP
jgi:hypothetical protein